MTRHKSLSKNATKSPVTLYAHTARPFWRSSLDFGLSWGLLEAANLGRLTFLTSSRSRSWAWWSPPPRRRRSGSGSAGQRTGFLGLLKIFTIGVFASPAKALGLDRAASRAKAWRRRTLRWCQRLESAVKRRKALEVSRLRATANAMLGEKSSERSE